MNEIKTPKIKVLRISISSENSHRASAVVRIGPLVIHGFRVIKQNPDDEPIVVGPMWERERRGVSGKMYFPVLQYPTSWHKAISEAVLAAWIDVLANGKNHDDITQMMETGLSWCCDASIETGAVIQSGRHKGHGPRYCSQCHTEVYRV